MKRRIVIFVVLMSSATALYSQRQPPRSPSTRDDRSARITSQQADQGLRQLKRLETKQTKEFAVDLNAPGFEIYRKHSKDDLGDLAPSEQVLAKYASFLSMTGTGIAKLNSIEKCGQNSEVVTAVEDCAKYQMPGGGTAYSFRFDSYRIPRLSDIILQNDVLKTDGVWQQGILVDLGNVPIEDVSSDSKALRFLFKYAPAANRSELDRSDRELASGIESDGHLYRLGFFANVNRTFALRSIAFQGSFVRTQNGIVYDEFKFDKREDVIVVFRVVDKEPNGNITIVWKELARKDAPQLKR